MVFQEELGPDTISPTVQSTMPVDGADKMSTYTVVTVTFSEPMDPATVNLTTVELTGVSAAVSFDSESNKAILIPNSQLAYFTVYTAVVKGGENGVKDAAGNPLESDYTWSFTTAEVVEDDTTPPVVSATSPLLDAENVSIDTVVTVTFSEAMHASTISAESIKLRDSSNIIKAAAVSYNSTTNAATLTPYAALATSMHYTVTVQGGAGGVADAAGNPMGVDYAWSFDTSAVSDTTPPVITSVLPPNDAPAVATGTSFEVIFSEAMDPGTINTTTFELRNSADVVIPAAVTYDAAVNRASLNPSTPMKVSEVFRAVVKGGAGGVKDTSGNPLAIDYTWLIKTAASSPLTNGHGGPILIITNDSDPFGRYFAEILLSEGLNAFTILEISSVSAAMLDLYDVAILCEMPLEAAQVSMFDDWVNAGGNLIAMRPDKKLSGLLGLIDTGQSLSEGYLMVDISSGPGYGIVGQTIQFHGTADLYTLDNATSLATIYEDATTPTSNPAVTLNEVGTNGGQAAAFTFDLARSIVYTRQGNPAWEGQERDGYPPVRSNDLFYGNSVDDPQSDWVDLEKVAIPQADEQQRLLANMIIQMNADKKPLPRFWYFPNGHEAVVIMTGDDHGGSGTGGRFEYELAASQITCSVEDWECIRSSSYMYPYPILSETQALAYAAEGFEIGIHLNTGCANYSPESLEIYFREQMADWSDLYPNLSPQVSHRAHCIAWSGYTIMPEEELRYGIRFDVNYYYWPPDWVENRPGFLTGSGMPMRFAAIDGSVIDVYQADTQMTDESGQTYPYTVDTLLDRAIGPEKYYGAFTVNMHTDGAVPDDYEAIIVSAVNRGVPVVSSGSDADWLDGRNGSFWDSLVWDGQTLQFNVVAAQGANGLQVMVPIPIGRQVEEVSRNGNSIGYDSRIVKGIAYVVFAADSGNYAVRFSSEGQPGDFDGDCDVDGTDLAQLAEDISKMPLSAFAQKFGIVECQ